MAELMVVKRSGEVVEFDAERIRNAMGKAIRAAGKEVANELLDTMVTNIKAEVESRFTDFFPNVENIQDVVEKQLMNNGFYEVAKAYILYRAERSKEREAQKKETIERARLGKLRVKKRDGRLVPFDLSKVRQGIMRCSRGYDREIATDLIVKETLKNIYDGATSEEISKAMILATIAFIENDPSYSYVGARLFLQRIYKEVIGVSISENTLDEAYRETFVRGIKKGVEEKQFDTRLQTKFDLRQLASSLAIERDELFKYIGIHTLYERYLMKTKDGDRYELPQAFWMRVAMGLAIEEDEPTRRAKEFYDALSSLRFVSSTPTLFHSGTMHPQLSSCYLTTVKDDLTHIFKCIGDNAQLSKWSGGLGNDWSYLRATGALIKSTNVESQGVVPFLKIANDTTVAINRSGKRRGATCAYLETWHYDIEEFMDLRRNTGDERRRTHDMDTANWIPDTFMKRVMTNSDWTLFSPEEVPDLHDLFGAAFEAKYIEYERKAASGQIRLAKKVPALQLWRKMLTRLFETGHPWITFKDPCNVRSPQDHAGVVHSSNLCTEITLNTSADETAVCNLGSVNLERHIYDGKLDYDMLAKTVQIGMRMLDNVVDINYYPTVEAKNSNMRHRPVGLGIMGVQDAFFKLDLQWETEESVKFTDKVMEFISFNAIFGSSMLAKERGTYSSYKGSKWDRDIFPQDTIDLLEQERGVPIEVSRDSRLDWTPVREHVRKYGMRNSNTMAIAPTATISNIAGCFPCIEPIYKNIYVKANIGGEFTVVNEYLITDLKRAGLWNQQMLEQLKYYDGNLQLIAGVPAEIKAKYKEAFEIDPAWLLRHTAERGRWIDQSQSHNVFMQGTSGKMLHDIYLLAWKMGLKTTYYLRSMAATQVEKSTLDAAKFGYTQQRVYNKQEQTVAATTTGGSTMTAGASPSTLPQLDGVQAAPQPKVCSIMDPDCEACQ